jgi:hypothetical protein
MYENRFLCKKNWGELKDSLSVQSAHSPFKR